MAFTRLPASKIAAIITCVPSHQFDNVRDTTEISAEEVRKVVAMAGVNTRRLVDENTCSSDLCIAAGRAALEALQWEPQSIDALILVTQTPDYFLPSTACVAHKQLGLSDSCASFDVGLGCSGYPYGLWLANMMLHSNGFQRVLLLHGETPSRFADRSDRAVSLLFGDAGSATAIEKPDSTDASHWCYGLHTDGSGYDSMIVEAGGFRNRFSTDEKKYFVRMNGAEIFNFTIKRIPELIQETLSGSGLEAGQIDYFIFHQSNRYIINFLVKKLKVPEEKVPLILKQYGNTGGPSIPLTITEGGLRRPSDRNLTLMLLGYGVGLSWGSAIMHLEPGAILKHQELAVREEK